MKKSTFLSIFVLVGALLLSVTSCTKNYDDDIKKLQSQVDAIKADLEKGKLVKEVTATATGFKITYADNTSTDIAVTGTAGAAGFTPVIGVDAEGYWTVITTQGGTATRIQSGGKDIKAVAEAPYIKEGNWWVGTTNTGIKATGEDGKDGKDGNAGAANNPTISKDTGNWMVWENNAYVDSGIKAQGPKGADGSDVASAKIDEDGYLWVGGVRTDIKNLPPVVMNVVNGTVVVTLDGQNYTLATADAYGNIATSMVRDVKCPSLMNRLTIELGKIVANVDFKLQDGTTVKYTKDQTTTKDVVWTLPMIVNPSTAHVNDNQVTIIDAKGNPFPVDNYTVTTGYDVTDITDPFTKATADKNTGLVSVNFKATDNLKITGIVGNSWKPLAIKVATSDDNNVFTSYEYDVNVVNAMNVLLQPVDTKLSIGAGLDLIKKALAAGSGKVMHSRIEFDMTDWVTTQLAQYVVNTDGQWISSVEIATRRHNLEGKTLKFKTFAIGLNGVVAQSTASVTFYVTFGPETLVYDTKATANQITTGHGKLVNGVYTLRTDDLATANAIENSFAFSFDPIAERIDKPARHIEPGRINYWQENVSNLVVTFKRTDKTGYVIPAGAFGTIITDVNKTNLYNRTYVAGTLTQPTKIAFVVDPTLAIEGKYEATLTFKDNRNFAYNTPQDAADSTQFKTTFAFEVKNPEGLFTGIKRVPQYFWSENGGTIHAYGIVKPYTWANGLYTSNASQNYDYPAGAIQQRFNINTAFYGHDVFAASGHTITFEKAVATDPDYIGGASDHWAIINMTSDSKNLYKAYKTKMMCALFGNVNNKVEVANNGTDVVSPFWIESRSEIEDGFIISVDRAGVATTGMKLRANAQNPAGAYLGDFYQVYDCYYRPAEANPANNLNAFGVDSRVMIGSRSDRNTRDPRIVSITVTPKAGMYYNWITATPVAAGAGAPNYHGNDFLIQTTNHSAGITSDVQVPVVIKITDRYGRSLEKEVTITVTP